MSHQEHDSVLKTQRLTEEEAERQINTRSPILVRSISKDAWDMKLVINIHFESNLFPYAEAELTKIFHTWSRLGETGSFPPGYFFNYLPILF